jgi:hypothetical protein
MRAWLLPFVPLALGQSHAELTSADDLKVALHDVLTRNDLFDVLFLSDRLGLGLRISHPETLDRDQTRYRGTATTNPPALYGVIRYEVDVDRTRQTSAARLSFASRSCAPLRQWGAEWHIQTSSGVATDGGPFYEHLEWPTSDGITLVRTAQGSGCNIEMLQTLRRVVSVPVSPELPRAAGGGLATQIASLLLSDLRDYAQVGRILNTEFIVGPGSERNGLLYRGSPFPGRVISGFGPYVDYSGNDSGWYEPPGFFARPLHIADRSVTLNLTADSEVVCLSQPQLAAELKQRGDSIHEQRSQSGVHSVYSVRSANRVSVSVTFKDGCATAVYFSQVTDIAHSLGDPIRFAPDDSLERAQGGLTDEAQRRINLLARRLRSVSLGGIEVEEMQGKQPGAPMRKDLGRLKLLINEALKRQGVDVSARANSQEAGECHMRVQVGEPVVCVDAWL